MTAMDPRPSETAFPKAATTGPTSRAAGPRLAVLRPSTETRSHSRWHTGFVRSLRVFLPVIAILLLAAIVIWPQMQSDDLRFRIGFAAITSNLDGEPNLLNPRYVGTDDKNRPFAITADIAKHLTGSDVPEERAEIGLEMPKADITMDDGTWLVLTADTGVYARGNEILDLEGSVNLFHDTGYEFRTEEATVDLNRGLASGDVPVEGQGPFGTLKAEGFRLIDRGQRIVFTGKSKLVLMSQDRAR